MLTGGVFYTGKQQVDSYNTESIPSHTMADAGARYAMQVGEKPLTLRLNPTNITGKDY